MSVVGVLAAAGMALTVGTAGASTAPAPAHSTAKSASVQKIPNGAKNYQDCHSGSVCLWGDSNYKGRYVFYSGNLSHPTIADSMNDLTTSIWNRTSSTICFYPDSNYRGLVAAVVLPGNSVPNITPYDNDVISSLRPC